MSAGIAAGHPATADAGLEILEEGGTAADAAVAASLASCVAETVMTGFLGGGHAIYLDRARGRVRNLDCFVAAPGLGAAPRARELVELEVPFGQELVHYAVGPASCGVPGLPAGLELLWREHGRLPWPRLVEPALALARSDVEMPPAHAACLEMLAPVLTLDAGARIYSPGGRLLEAGDRLRQPGLVAALELVASEGAGGVYRSTIAERLLELADERGGLLTRGDLRAYAACWSEPDALDYRGTRFLTRTGLSGVAGALGRLPRLAGAGATGRTLALVSALEGDAAPGETTNLAVADREGNACVLTTSLGLGSGDYLPGLDLHLNSMLGETDLLRGPLDPGERVGSMMAPSIALDGAGSGRLELAIGAAGGTRLRSALVAVAAAVLDEGVGAQEAVDRPRVHPAAGTVHAEPATDEPALVELERRGWAVRRWPDRHHFFGGVSLVGRTGSAADPRRSGAAMDLP
ncbi:MAG: gamma-glutamyltransferase [Gaiellaceae bacterium]